MKEGVRSLRACGKHLISYSLSNLMDNKSLTDRFFFHLWKRERFIRPYDYYHWPGVAIVTEMQLLNFPFLSPLKYYETFSKHTLLICVNVCAVVHENRLLIIVQKIIKCTICTSCRTCVFSADTKSRALILSLLRTSSFFLMYPFSHFSGE